MKFGKIALSQVLAASLAIAPSFAQAQQTQQQISFTSRSADLAGVIQKGNRDLLVVTGILNNAKEMTCFKDVKKDDGISSLEIFSASAAAFAASLIMLNNEKIDHALLKKYEPNALNLSKQIVQLTNASLDTLWDAAVLPKMTPEQTERVVQELNNLVKGKSSGDINALSRFIYEAGQKGVFRGQLAASDEAKRIFARASAVARLESSRLGQAVLKAARRVEARETILGIGAVTIVASVIGMIGAPLFGAKDEPKPLPLLDKEDKTVSAAVKAMSDDCSTHHQAEFESQLKSYQILQTRLAADLVIKTKELSDLSQKVGQ